MIDEVVRFLEPRAGGRYVDATLGGGGHALAILEASGPDGLLLGLDRDPDAIAATKSRLGAFEDRTTFVCDRYSRLKTVLEETGYGHPSERGPAVDGIVLDAGVSSYQLDTPDRGFSFRDDGPLDMRMSRSGQTCGELLDTVGERELARILKNYGETTHSRKLARAILERRESGELNTTGDLAELVVEIIEVGPRQKRIHPATQVFQALRIAVNQELRELEELCTRVPDLLADDGVAVIISFHRLEDRVVKRMFASHSRGPDIPASIPLTEDARGVGPLDVLTRRPIRPGEREVQRNPRARSARLRAARRRRDSTTQTSLRS